MIDYKGVPNKKRRALIDPAGDIYPLGLGVTADDRTLVASSGTMSAAGDLTVTGTLFKWDSVVTASYRDTSAGTAPIAVTLADGTAAFKGDNNAAFYYIVIN